jgi:hypothetical protein
MTNELLAMLCAAGWTSAPAERDPNYFRRWQRVSIALQNALRRWIPEMYFRDEFRFDDREEAYQVVAYSASQPFHGRARTEFTYDVADPATLEIALRNTGRRMQAALGPIELRLRASGRLELARRYAPVWYLDILGVVEKRHRRLIGLLACEAKVIDAVIDLGTARDAAAVKRFLRIANASLRNVGGVDFRERIPSVIEEAGRILNEQHRALRGADDIVDGGIFEGDRSRAAGSPDGGIGGQKNRDYRSSDRGDQMTDAGIVADINARLGEPATQLV